jgi:hypothetical protein
MLTEWIDDDGAHVLRWGGGTPSCVYEVNLNSGERTTFLTAVDDESRAAIFEALMRGDAATCAVVRLAILAYEGHGVPGGHVSVVHCFDDADAARPPTYRPHIRPMGKGDHNNAWRGSSGWRDDPTWQPPWVLAIHSRG